MGKAQRASSVRLWGRAVHGGLVGMVALVAIGITVVLSGPAALAAGPAQQTREYQVYGGKLSGRLTKLDSIAQFHGSDVHFLFDPTRISLSVTSPQFFVAQGALYQGQWTYPYEVIPDVGSGVDTISVAVNTRDHTQLIVTGVPTTQALAQVQRPQPTQRAQVAQAACPFVATTACYRGARYVSQDTFWDDLAGIHLNEVYTRLACDYYSNPSSVNCFQHWDDPTYTRDYGSCWSMTSHSFSWHYYNSGTAAEADSNARFHCPNFPACAGHYTDTVYQPNWARITSTGSYAGNVNTWVVSNSQVCVGDPLPYLHLCWVGPERSGIARRPPGIVGAAGNRPGGLPAAT